MREGHGQEGVDGVGVLKGVVRRGLEGVEGEWSPQRWKGEEDGSG